MLSVGWADLLFRAVAFWVSLCSVCRAGVAWQVFTPPADSVIAGVRETAKHRPEPPPVRYGRAGLTSVDLWVHVGRHGRVTEVRNDGSSDALVPAVENAAKQIIYAPFTRGGKPVDAWVQDRITVITAEETPRERVPFPEVEDWSQVSITLSRSGCYGRCPSYTVTIQGDGKTAYVGEKFVSIAGAHVARIDPAKVHALLKQFQAANFFGLRDVYHSAVTDSPTHQLTVKIGAQSKTVTDSVGEWVGMPTAVKELEAAVDATSDSQRWVTSSPATLEVLAQDGVGLTSSEAIEVLHNAVYGGDVFTAGRLLEAGTPNQSLPQLAVESRHPGTRAQMLKTVLSSAAVVGDRDSLQRGLASAVRSGETQLAQVLISAGADPTVRFADRNFGTVEDQTYLMLAGSSGVWSMIDDALARPNDIHAVDSKGRTSLVQSAYNAPMIEDIFPIVDRFLAAGASRSELDRILLDTCQPRWIPGLVARGGNVNARDANGNTPLFGPCTVEGVEALLDASANPYLRNNAGKSALEATFTQNEAGEDPRAGVIRRFCATHPEGSFQKVTRQ